MIGKLLDAIVRWLSRRFQTGPRIFVVGAKEEESEIRAFMIGTKFRNNYEILVKTTDPRKFANYGGDQLVLISEKMKDDTLAHQMSKLAEWWEFEVYTFKNVADLRNRVANFIKES